MGEVQPSDNQLTIVWEPQEGPQTALITCPVFEVFFGGSRGGGKTDGMLGEWVSHADLYGKDAIGLMVRRTRTELSETIERSKTLYLPLGWKWHEQDKYWRAPNNARLKFAYLENDADADSYQGHAYTRVYVEEIGNFPREAPVLKLMASLRSAAGVPTGFRATGNPGGVGHQWVKARYIDHAPQGWVVTTHKYLNPFTKEYVSRDRVFIPSRLTDNQLLLHGDPNYVANLQMQASPELVRAWLEGDWNIVAGAAFEKLSTDKHMIRPFDIPKWWTRFTCIDWGTARPYSNGWYAVADEDVILKGRNGEPDRFIAKNSIIRYRELYGWNGKANEGCREESWQVAAKILEMEGAECKTINGEPTVIPKDGMEQEKIDYRIGDSAMWAEHDGPSVEENFRKNGIVLERSRKDRVANYLEIRNRISNHDEQEPSLYVTSNCTHWWRTVPSLQLDAKNPEKGWDSNMEDHAADETGYALVSRPMTWTKTARTNYDYEEARDKAFEAERGKSGSRY